jgi:hypothetical protein
MVDVFISYAHVDKAWLERLQTFLKSYATSDGFEVWADTRIRSGDSWQQEIDRALQTARAAILLVTPEFLASEFVRQNELPVILAHAANHGVLVYWLAVRHSPFETTAIKDLQCANDPSYPLEALPRDQQDKVLLDVCRSLAERLGSRKEDDGLAVSKNLEPPLVYDFDFLRRDIARRFGAETGFLVVQFGSSVRTPRNARDEDYIALVHGNRYLERVDEYQVGTVRKPAKRFMKAIDIHVRLLDSFMVGLIMGRPFEISVAVDGVAIDAHQMPSRYWDWFKVLAHNVLVDVAYLRKELTSDLEPVRRAYVRALTSRDMYRVIIAAYTFVCTYVQITMLREFPEVVPATRVYRLSQVAEMRDYLPDAESIAAFGRLVQFFKRDLVPKRWEDIEDVLDVLVTRLELEV